MTGRFAGNAAIHLARGSGNEAQGMRILPFGIYLMLYLTGTV
jgi:hypothetical protein